MVTANGQVITGAVTSTTVIVCTQVLALPQLSVAVQFRVMTTEQGSVLLVASAYVITGVASQLSVAVAVPVFAGNVDSSQLMVTANGPVITGAVTSTTVIVCTQVLALPQMSVAVQVREITTNQRSVFLIAPPPVISTLASHLSLAVAVPVFAGNVDS